MHEMSLFNGLIEKLKSVSLENDSAKILKVEVEIGALANISKEHFREHFLDFTKGTVADGAELVVHSNQNIYDRYSQEIRLLRIEVECH